MAADKLTHEGTFDASARHQVQEFLVNTDAVPATASAPGKPGQIAADGTDLYVCVAKNTWLKVGIATW